MTWQPMAMAVVDPAASADMHAMEAASRTSAQPTDGAGGLRHSRRADRGMPAHAVAVSAPANQQARPQAGGHVRARTVDLNSALHLPTAAAEQADARASAPKAPTLRWGHAPARTTLKGKDLVATPLCADALPLFELVPRTIVEDTMVNWSS
jgi:hypothetical protein